MSRGTWKAVERRLAALLGGVRVPVSGRTRGDRPDIDHKTLSLEVKHRKNPPALLVDAMDQAVKSARGKQIPLVIVHHKGHHHKNDYCVMRFEDYMGLLRAAKLLDQQQGIDEADREIKEGEE